jgi:hypothetical protein
MDTVHGDLAVPASVSGWHLCLQHLPHREAVTAGHPREGERKMVITNPEGIAAAPGACSLAVTETQVNEAALILVTRLTNEINWVMRDQGLTRASLAARMGVPAGRVSQVLAGGENLTLRMLAGLSRALHARFGVELGALSQDASAAPDEPGSGSPTFIKQDD